MEARFVYNGANLTGSKAERTIRGSRRPPPNQLLRTSVCKRDEKRVHCGVVANYPCLILVLVMAPTLPPSASCASRGTREALVSSLVSVPVVFPQAMFEISEVLTVNQSFLTARIDNVPKRKNKFQKRVKTSRFLETVVNRMDGQKRSGCANRICGLSCEKRALYRCATPTIAHGRCKRCKKRQITRGPNPRPAE